MSVDFTTLLRERRPASAIRGQSETTSVAIAVALVVVLVAAAGVFIFGDVTDSEDDTTLASIESDVTVSSLTISYSSGDTLDPENVRVVLEGNSTVHDSTLAAFSDPASDNETVSAGDTWQQDLNRFIGEAQLQVIHEPTNTILHEQQHSVTLPDGGLTLSIDGATNSTELPGDATAANDSQIRFPYTVTGTFDGGETVDVTDSATLAFAPDSALSATGNGTVQTQEPSGDSQTVTVTASFQNRRSNAVAVTVRDGVNYTVAIDDSKTGNNTVTVNYTVTNEGTITGQQDIEFVVAGNGTVDTTPDVTLAPGDSHTGQFTQTLNVTNATVTVRTADDSAVERFSFADIVYVGNTSYKNNSVYVYGTTDWQLKQTFEGVGFGPVGSSPEGAFLGYSNFSHVRIHETDNWKIQKNISVGVTPGAPVWSPDSSRLAVDYTEITRRGYIQKINIYETGNWQQEQSFAQGRPLRAPVAWSPDGSYLATGAKGNISIYETNNWQLEQAFTEPQNTRKPSVTWSPDGSRLAYAAGDTVYVYGTSNWQLQQTVSETNRPVEAVKWSPEGSQLAYATNDSVYVHDTDTWQLDQTLTEAGGNVSSLEWSPAGIYLAYGSGDTNVYVHETSDWTLAQQLTNAEGEVSDITFLP